MEIQVFNLQGEAVGKAELPAEVFGIKPSAHFLHEIVTQYLNNRRRWSAHTKTRSEVSGGGHKPWRQKHTGRARAGSIRSPLWRKGGIVFGPRTVELRFKRTEVPRKKSRIALAQALSVQAAAGKLKVVSALSFDGAKTGQVVTALRTLEAGRRVLVVVDQLDRNLVVAARNIPDVRILLASHLNAYEVLRCATLIVTQAALEKIRSRWN
ncbi:MAG: 50S ribosomal protein L4 [Elusimicrobia bacterium]|nr:50S ribosomal protein L4 [Elusimicrobiota bacterium]